MKHILFFIFAVCLLAACQPTSPAIPDTAGPATDRAPAATAAQIHTPASAIPDKTAMVQPTATSTSTAANTTIPSPTPSPEPIPGINPAEICLPAVGGPAYELVFQIPVGPGGLDYRGMGVQEMQTTGPNALAVLPDGSFMIADPLGNRLLRYDAQGEPQAQIDLYNLGIVNVSDLVATPQELHLLEISFSVAPERYRVSRLSFDGEVIAQYDLPPGYHFEDGLYGLAPAGSQGEMLLEFYGEALRIYQLTGDPSEPVKELAGIPAYGHSYQAIFGSFIEPRANPAIQIDELRVESELTLGGLVKILAVNPDGSFFAIREDTISDFPVIQGDITIHLVSREGEQWCAARYPLAEWAFFVQRYAALGPDGQVYALLPRTRTVDVLRLNLYPALEPLIPSATQPLVGR